MICPYCDSRIDFLPANHICPHCSGSLLEIQNNYADSLPAPPPGKYESTTCYIELRRKDLLIHKKVLSKIIERAIAYKDIVAVALYPAKGLGLGYLAIREKKDLHITLPSKLMASSDETTAIFGYYDNDKFRQLYGYLKPYADRYAALGRPVPPARVPTAPQASGITASASPAVGFCPRCGMRTGANFCPNCGIPLRSR